MMAESESEDRARASQALEALEDSVRDCRLCGLCAERTQVVFGVGSPWADLMFVGEAPGFHEDRLGEPFVGQAGKLLTELLAGIGLRRADVYIANVVKCRPPGNRDPVPAEIEACSPHLLEQIAIIHPKVICTLGRFATKLLADTELSMTVVHGKAKSRTIAGVETVVFPVFHPAAALYTPANRQMLEEDFAKLRQLLLQGPGSRSKDAAHDMRAEAARDAAAGESRAPVEGSEAKNPRSSSSTTEQLPLW